MTAMTTRDDRPSHTPPLFLVLDRVVDGEWAVLEMDPEMGTEGEARSDGGAGADAPSNSLILPLAWLPAGVQEGDVLRVETVAGARDARVTLTQDAKALAERAARVDALRRAIPRGPSGDITL